jgi:hypothetical protein
MKKISTYLLLSILTGGIGILGQSSELIISDNFQEWEASQEIVVPDSCEAGYEHPPELSGTLELLTASGTVDIPVKLIKCSVSPECGSKKEPSNVTIGYISLMKMDGKSMSDLVIEDWGSDVDTLGQFSFGPIPQIDSIVFEHSATGSERGIRIFKSTDGTVWERATEDEFNDGASQNGVTRKVDINEEDVYIKFTSGFKVDETSQISRLHSIMVYGVPGEVVAIHAPEVENLSVLPLGSGLFRIEGEFNALNVYNTIGAKVYTRTGAIEGNIDLSGVPSGIYIVHAQDRSGKIFVSKILRD